MDYNYHAHTVYCHHATGTMEEYIQRAIECGVKYMGFSDHAPFIHPDGHEAGYRVEYSKAHEYISLLSDLREKYKDKIDLKIGFEMEYYPKYFEKMLQDVKNFGAEYLILGQHLLYNEEGEIYSAGIGDNREHLKVFADTVIEAIKTQKFTYIAHPDMVHYKGDLLDFQYEMRRICVASREYNIPLEINFLGIRDNRHYPNTDFWLLAGEEQSPVTYGFDAHDVMSAYDGDSIVKADEIVKKYNLNYIGKPNVISIKD